MSELVISDARTRERAAKIISALALERPWLVKVEPWHEKRSTTQNARLWALHQKAAAHTGMSADDMHEIALCRFFGYEEKTIGGIIRQIPLERSSTKNKKQFGEFMEATEAWYISELGIWLE